MQAKYETGVGSSIVCLFTPGQLTEEMKHAVFEAMHEFLMQHVSSLQTRCCFQFLFVLVPRLREPRKH